MLAHCDVCGGGGGGGVEGVVGEQGRGVSPNAVCMVISKVPDNTMSPMSCCVCGGGGAVVVCLEGDKP